MCNSDGATGGGDKDGIEMGDSITAQNTQMNAHAPMVATPSPPRPSTRKQSDVDFAGGVNETGHRLKINLDSTDSRSDTMSAGDYANPMFEGDQQVVATERITMADDI